MIVKSTKDIGTVKGCVVQDADVGSGYVMTAASTEPAMIMISAVKNMVT